MERPRESAIARLTRERDEARAEVERLRAGLRGLIAEWETRDPAPSAAPSDFFAGCDIARNACAEDARALLASAETEEER